VFIGAGVNQLGSDSHPVSGSKDRFLNYNIDVQLARDLWQRLVGTFVLHGRGAGDDSQRSDLAKVGDHGVVIPSAK
jgi:hypothetical protein